MIQKKNTILNLIILSSMIVITLLFLTSCQSKNFNEKDNLYTNFNYEMNEQREYIIVIDEETELYKIDNVSITNNFEVRGLQITKVYYKVFNDKTNKIEYILIGEINKVYYKKYDISNLEEFSLISLKGLNKFDFDKSRVINYE